MQVWKRRRWRNNRRRNVGLGRSGSGLLLKKKRQPQQKPGDWKLKRGRPGEAEEAFSELGQDGAHRVRDLAQATALQRGEAPPPGPREAVSEGGDMEACIDGARMLRGKRRFAVRPVKKMD
jgi:hypothetical protein